MISSPSSLLAIFLRMHREAFKCAIYVRPSSSKCRYSTRRLTSCGTNFLPRPLRLVYEFREPNKAGQAATLLSVPGLPGSALMVASPENIIQCRNNQISLIPNP